MFPAKTTAFSSVISYLPNYLKVSLAKRFVCSVFDPDLGEISTSNRQQINLPQLIWRGILTTQEIKLGNCHCISIMKALTEESRPGGDT